MVIRHPFTSGQTWSLRKTVIAVILIVFASFVMETPYIFACKFLPLDLHSFSNFSNNTSELACHVQYADWLNDSGIIPYGISTTKTIRENVTISIIW
jgi:hypothetical protein